MLTLHPRDAAARGILPGSLVRARNDRGAVVARAELTQSIQPGVACLEEGVWMEPGADGEDTAGSANFLTDTEGSAPSKACVMHGIEVEVERA